jgi:hypothetical protein
VSQISPPFRIALLAMLAVCAVWFTVLKPKTPASDTATPTAPGVTGLANDVDAAKGAAKTSDAANAKVQNATGGTAAQTDTSAAAKPKSRGANAAAAGKTSTATAKAAPAKKAAADASAPLLTALDEHKAVVLLFYNAKGSDDRAVRAAAQRVSRRKGRVIVKSVPVRRVGRYSPITRGVSVTQTPMVVVLAPGNTARTIAGFTTEREIDQLVGDALAANAGK